MRHVLLQMDVLYLTTFGHLPTVILKLGRARIIFNVTPTGFI